MNRNTNQGALNTLSKFFYNAAIGTLAHATTVSQDPLQFAVAAVLGLAGFVTGLIASRKVRRPRRKARKSSASKPDDDVPDECCFV